MSASSPKGAPPNYGRFIPREELQGYLRRVRRLADQRTTEGYLAEVVRDGDDLLLIEHHCPICSAARSCQSLCRAEMEVFRTALGADISVTREQHVLSGDQRCAYRITAA